MIPGRRAGLRGRKTWLWGEGTLKEKEKPNNKDQVYGSMGNEDTKKRRKANRQVIGRKRMEGLMCIEDALHYLSY